MVIKRDRKYHYAVGRRKTAVATVRLYENGKGEFSINDKDIKEYVNLSHVIDKILSPLKVTDTEKTFDVSVKVMGSGTVAQGDAIALGIAKALVVFNPEIRLILKPHGLLTRDPRRAERKKPGLHGARRGVQFSKR